MTFKLMISLSSEAKQIRSRSDFCKSIRGWGTSHYNMRIARKIIGALFVIAGGIWFLQGINIIPGSFMTGQTKWTIYGALTAMVGLFLLFGPTRRSGAPD